MTIALVTLAFLQYRWLGSVSDAEKERLEESLSASAENFVTDFNEVFTELNSAFRIQVSDSNNDIKTLLNQSYTNWNINNSYSELVDSVFIVRKGESGEPKVFLFSTDPVKMEQVFPSKSITDWIKKDAARAGSVNRLSLRIYPELNEQSFLATTVQLLDLVQVRNQDIGQKIEVQLTVDHLDDIILLKLNDQLIKDEIIPDIARTYFSDSFDDQYQLSLVKNDNSGYAYYTSGTKEEIPVPDVRKSLDRSGISNIMVFQSQSYSSSATSISNAYRFSNDEVNFVSGFSLDSLDQGSYFLMDNLSKDATNIETNESALYSFGSSDTAIAASLAGPTPWELWLSFREGSLDAFVNKTRTRNLGISFGILLILGVSVVLIVVFSQRSRELAEQQMLFVAGVSHELRTPITVIRSAAENLTEGVVQSEERKKEYAHLMLKEGRRLSDMVDQIMEFSGIQSGKRVYHFRTINLEELFDSIKEESRHLLDEKKMHLEYSINTKQESINADPDALFLSITNLIANAIKFNGDSKKILLKVDEVSLKGELALRIQVQDFGIGIPEKEQGFIFKPFFRGEKPVSEQVKGNGIGLSLVQKVVNAHQGQVTLKSKEGEGSTFSLILPLGRANG